MVKKYKVEYFIVHLLTQDLRINFEPIMVKEFRYRWMAKLDAFLWESSDMFTPHTLAFTEISQSVRL